MDEQETTPITEDTNPGTPDTQAPVETPEVEETPAVPEVVEVPVEETPAEDASTTDVAPEDVPVVHKDNGSVGRELDHVVQQ